MVKRFKKSERGSALALAGIMTIIMVVSISGFLAFVFNEFAITKKSLNNIKAFYVADGGIQYAEYYVSANNHPSNLTNYPFTINGNTAYIDVTEKTSSTSDRWLFEVVSRATVNGVTKTIEAVIEKNPPSKVFDYVYFINNWGYMWGSTIYLYGDARSNGHFGILWRPTLNGHLYAGGNIHRGADYNDPLTPSDVNGLASNPDYWHPHADQLKMPNLYKMSFYEDLAKSKHGKIWIGPPNATPTSSNTVVDEVYGDDAGESDHLIIATNSPSDVIHIDGPVVIRGNVIIKGKITGQGCIYSGRNIYFAGDIQYNNPPDFSSRPWDQSDPNYEAEISQWVENNKDKDLIGFAAQENLIAGNWQESSWYPNYFKDMWENWGNEDVGKDGIPNTNDEGEGDGIWNSEYEDVDEDGIQDDNYSYNNDVIPTDFDGTTLSFSDFDSTLTGATKYSDVFKTTNISHIDGILYTNHLVPMGVTVFELNGCLVSKDEAIVFSSFLKMNYDDRINSRFRDYENYDLVVDIPRDLTARIVYWKED